MKFPTMQKNKEDFKQPVFEDEGPPPMVRMDQNDLIIENRENSSLNEMGKKILPNLLIVVGSFFLFTQTALNFSNYVLKPHSTISQPLNSLFCLLGGLILLFLSLGKIKKKSDWLLYAIIPLMSILFSLIFNLVPKDWLMLNAFAYSLFLTYPLVLSIFYYLKRYFETSDGEIV